MVNISVSMGITQLFAFGADGAALSKKHKHFLQTPKNMKIGGCLGPRSNLKEERSYYLYKASKTFFCFLK